MGDLLTLWWMWICAALVLGVIELLLPGSIFLGFALGALAMAILLLVLPVTNIPALIALFAILSLFSWFMLRLVFRRQSSGARIVTRDINEK